MNAPTDYLGRTIRPGDLLVYAWRRNSALGLSKMNVTLVEENSVTGYAPTGRRVTIKNLHNAVVVERPQTEPPRIA